MKTKALIILFGVLLVLGLVSSIYFGLKPKPIPKINLSGFESPAKLAQAVELRMRGEIQEASILALGFQPEKADQLEFVQAFLKINTEPGLAYDTVVIEDAISDLSGLTNLNGAEKINMKDRIDELAEGLRTALQQKRRVLLIMPSIYSAQMLSMNVVSQLKTKFQIPITSFSVVELPRTREEEKSVIIPCLVSDADNVGTGPLGCAILQEARGLYHKKTDSSKGVAVMDQRGLTDYLIFSKF